jgi:hypothetical protein
VRGGPVLLQHRRRRHRTNTMCDVLPVRSTSAMTSCCAARSMTRTEYKITTYLRTRDRRDARPQESARNVRHVREVARPRLRHVRRARVQRARADSTALADPKRTPTRAS